MITTEAPLLEAIQTTVKRARDSELTRQYIADMAATVSTVTCSTGEFRLVHGEAGIPNWGEAFNQLVNDRFQNPLEAWMVAGVLAAGIASAHEFTTGQRVTEQMEFDLRQQLTDFALTR